MNEEDGRTVTAVQVREVVPVGHRHALVLPRHGASFYPPVTYVRVADILSGGAVGYLLKDCDGREVLAAIRSAALGHAPLDPRVARALLPSATPRIKDTLSVRELQVLRLVAKGLANKQVGRALGISERTVKVHVTHVFRRIGVTDRTSAAIWARDNLSADGQR